MTDQDIAQLGPAFASFLRRFGIRRLTQPDAWWRGRACQSRCGGEPTLVAAVNEATAAVTYSSPTRPTSR